MECPVSWPVNHGEDLTQPDNQNPDGDTDFGMGDLLMQAIYVREIDQRWADGIGLRTVLPTATGVRGFRKSVR